MTTTLTINSRVYNASELLAAVPDHGALGDNARAALDFCRRWLSGQVEFTVHTSGSTGAPKPITLRREQMEASAQATGQALGLRPGMAALVCLPVRYIAGQMMLARGLTLDMPLTVVEPAGDPLASLPIDASFEFTAVIPLQLQTLLDSPPQTVRRLNAMHAVLVGGAPVSAALAEGIARLTAPVWHTYGMTETVTHVALRRLNGPEASPWFHPLPGVELAVDDRGCLRVRGPMTLDRWVQTNDLVELASRPPGGVAFRWLGRWDHVINSGGVKVAVEQVEAAVERAWPACGLATRRFFVAGLPDERLGQAVTLVIEGDPLGEAGENALRGETMRGLERYQAPRRIVYRPRFIETETGKIDRAATLAAADDPSALPSARP